MPLLDFLETLRLTGSRTAHVNYGARGFAAHHNADIWGLSSPVGEGRKGVAVHCFWPLSGGWLSAHAFNHYAYTKDKVFLREKAWPIIRDAARFFLDVLTPDTDGTLIFVPSTSPENAFVYQGEHCAVSKTTTMTTAIIRETLSNAVRCCDILGIESDFQKEVRKSLEQLPTYKIGSRGELLEWSEDLQEAEPTHRHNSHLYPLYPSNDITLDETPELAEACSKTLKLRGDESTGWALAWRVNLWARLRKADQVFSLLKKTLRPVKGNKIEYGEGGGSYPNMFGAHPPFQIDSNFGVCAGIMEMLLQSREGLLILLPALPKELGTGSVKGLRAIGGITVNMNFRNGRVEYVELKLAAGFPECKIKLRYNDKETIVSLASGSHFELKD
jgi:alpha-L-fucosidase 2